jgi:hypothetical protein
MPHVVPLTEIARGVARQALDVVEGDQLFLGMLGAVMRSDVV